MISIRKRGQVYQYSFEISKLIMVATQEMRKYHIVII